MTFFLINDSSKKTKSKLFLKDFQRLNFYHAKGNLMVAGERKKKKSDQKTKIDRLKDKKEI